ncbi:AMP-binding protein [Longispora sp. K20-0274]|uniref:AMP-binding protein n=1 Tax=Longispora sp. K20-0274 TaxID=3088255 RepID=UPI00399C2459
MPKNYISRVLDLFAQYGHAEAIVADNRRLTYHELITGTLSIAAALFREGIRPGMAVGALASTAPEAVMLQFAVHLMGGRIAWIAPNSPAAFRERFLDLAAVDAFVYDARAYAEAGAKLAAGTGLPVLCLGPGGEGPDVTAGPTVERVADLPFDPADVTGEPQALFQTSGTTGQPKLVHHTQRFFDTACAFAAQYVESGQHAMKHLALGGFWVVSSQMPAHMALLTGGTYYTVSSFETVAFLDLIARERITDTLLTPPFLYFLLDHPAFATADCSSLLRVNVGGAPVAPSRLSQAIRRLGPVLRTAYGMSEAPIIAAYQNIPDDPAVLSSVGQPYGDLRLEIRDPAGAPVATGEVGEVWLSGGVMMVGYWGQPELTAETLVDGWLRTGDMGYLDGAGNLFLVDRVKDMILTGWGSTNIYARPVEDLLASHPAVRAAAVIGVPSQRYGEVVHAYVVADPEAVTAEELRDLVRGGLGAGWTPEGVDFVDALPLTETNKVDKKALRARYQAG